MQRWPHRRHQAFLALAAHAAVAGPLCRAVATESFNGTTRLDDICAAAGLAQARSVAVEAALLAGEAHGLFIRCGPMEWQPVAMSFGDLATALEAVAIYREHVHSDADLVDVVLTPPGSPSQLGDALHARGWIEADLEHTGAILRHLAVQSNVRFAVLSPFLDSGGVEHLIALFEATREDVKRVLITRCPDGTLPPPLYSAMSTLNALGVSVHNYWLPRASGYETFHAKVLIADDRMAYIGSANMTQASLWLSMELGIFLRGNSVKTLASVVDSILAVAKRVE